MRALLVGLFAFCLVTQASAATMQGGTTQAPRKAKVEQRALTLDERLERKVAALRKYRGTVRFFENRRSLLRRERPADAGALLARVREEARSAVDEDGRRTPREGPRADGSESSRRSRRAQRSAPSSGRTARRRSPIAWCESRLSTRAQNGQYLGLFQMGSYERQLFGHGQSARDQAVAAHRYFVRSGRDWSPWACRWAAS